MFSFRYMIFAVIVPLLFLSGCKTAGRAAGGGCPEPENFYHMRLWEGDYFSVTLKSKLRIETPKGSNIIVPANNIRLLVMDTDVDGTVYFCDDMKVAGEIINDHLLVRFSSTGKKERVKISKIERLINVEKEEYAAKQEVKVEPAKKSEKGTKDKSTSKIGDVFSDDDL